MSLERELIERAWSDPGFASQLAGEPEVALAALGVTVPDGMRVDILMQRRDTLYYVIPPFVPGGDPNVITNQMDLWRSADEFIWIMPEGAKVDLLGMRRQHRAWADTRKDHIHDA